MRSYPKPAKAETCLHYCYSTPMAGNNSTDYLDPTLVSKLKNMEVKARLIVEGFITGLHKSPYHGFSVEFAEHRPYNNGDDLRHVDWKVFGRSDRYYLKQYEEETNLRNYVVLDTSASMRYKGTSELSKLEYGSYLAAALHYLMVKQRDATGLITFDHQLQEIIRPKSTKSNLRLLLSKLQEINDREAGPDEKTGAATALHRIAERVTRRSLVVLITDLFENVAGHDDLIKALKHLRHRKHEVLVFHVLNSETERAFKFPDLPMLFRDVETGEQISVHPSQMREEYTEAVKHFSERLRKNCLQYNIDFEEIDSGTPFDKALLAYLNKRKLLH